MRRPAQLCVLFAAIAGLLAMPLPAVADLEERAPVAADPKERIPAAADPEDLVPGFAERLEKYRAPDGASPSARESAPSILRHEERPTVGLEALGHSYNPASFLNPELAPPEINSDLAFWGDHAFQGNYDGFRIINISDPDDPQEVSHARCNGSQGDVVVWENILVRSWNSPAGEASRCDGEAVPVGFEGLHVWDISNLAQPEMIASIELPCGSHTATAVPDPENDRLLVYNQGAGGPCYFMDIVTVPLDDPASAELLWQEPLRGQNGCHDSGVILGDVNMMVCASGSQANVFDIGDNEWSGGTLDDPEFLYTIEEEGVGRKPAGEDHSGNWHSATFTWDGEVIVLGWEPGGGGDPECEATDPDVTHSAFFYDAKTGDKLGQWTLPRAQTAEENCTIHNYNVVPMPDGRDILVSGNYQAGTWVTEFTNPARPRVLAYSDPAPLEPVDIGGAWSSYWYNGIIYESSITEGLNLFRLTRRPGVLRQAVTLEHLNPQTQEFSLQQ